MPSLLFHLIDSAVPADSYASMPFQVEGTDFMDPRVVRTGREKVGCDGTNLGKPPESKRILCSRG